MKADHLFVLGRIPVHVNDYVTILPSSPGARDGFVGRVKSARFEQIGERAELREVTVVGARGNRAPAWRTFAPARIAPIRPDRQRRLQESPQSPRS